MKCVTDDEIVRPVRHRSRSHSYVVQSTLYSVVRNPLFDSILAEGIPVYFHFYQTFKSNNSVLCILCVI